MSDTWNKIISPKCHVESIAIPIEFHENPVNWLTHQAKEHGLRWLLAHAHDGIIWGELRGETLHLSTILAGPTIREGTLQDVRMFGDNGELFAWRDNISWRSRIIQDEKNEIEDVDFFDETYLLWGDGESNRNDSFVLLYEGIEGLNHAPPVVSDDQITHISRMGLKIRHYFGNDGDGQAFIAYSRLVSISQGHYKEES